jgi:hypothetical protein
MPPETAPRQLPLVQSLTESKRVARHYCLGISLFQLDKAATVRGIAPDIAPGVASAAGVRPTVGSISLALTAKIVLVCRRPISSDAYCQRLTAVRAVF